MSPQVHHNHLHLLLLQYQVSAFQKDGDLYGLLSLLAHTLLFVQVPIIYIFLRKALSSSNKHIFYENICQKLLDVYYIVLCPFATACEHELHYYFSFLEIK